MISTLLEQRYRSGAPLPDHEIAHLMITLLMADNIPARRLAPGPFYTSRTAHWPLREFPDAAFPSFSKFT
jgi:hypothetical protein